MHCPSSASSLTHSVHSHSHTHLPAACSQVLYTLHRLLETQCPTSALAVQTVWAETHTTVLPAAPFTHFLRLHSSRPSSHYLLESQAKRGKEKNTYCLFCFTSNLSAFVRRNLLLTTFYLHKFDFGTLQNFCVANFVSPIRCPIDQRLASFVRDLS